jgi:hypothetical protein
MIMIVVKQKDPEKKKGRAMELPNEKLVGRTKSKKNVKKIIRAQSGIEPETSHIFLIG